ncbi:hypothetical protein GCM10010502_34450 [Kitasatospora aureofaciens]|uniref:Uncharacterized protein n=1 Tax=Kitasatospora aureofaciens TaxID=1894 RepID=A0A8H9HP06_KITAU|nr:hypothetical protein GCM10010502_34450 [Kitasatospora aureofaciens]
MELIPPAVKVNGPVRVRWFLHCLSLPLIVACRPFVTYGAYGYSGTQGAGGARGGVGHVAERFIRGSPGKVWSLSFAYTGVGV